LIDSEGAAGFIPAVHSVGVIVFEWFRNQRRRSEERKLEKFCIGRQPQTDSEFIKHCSLPEGTKEAAIALAVRRAVAKTGRFWSEGISSDYIVVSDNYPGTLEALPVWESMDWVEFLMQLEDAIPDHLSESECEMIIGQQGFSNPGGGPVSDIIERTIAVLAKRSKPQLPE
jgi:hypothetical protein